MRNRLKRASSWVWLVPAMFVGVSAHAEMRITYQAAGNVTMIIGGAVPAASAGRGQSGLSAVKTTGARRGLYTNMVRKAAVDARIDPDLLASVVDVESAFDPFAVSPAGAAGLMQLMPATSRRFGVDDPFNPASNLRAGASYLRLLLDRFADTELALAAYNAGEGAVIRNGMRIPPYRETQAYVPKVMARYDARRRHEANSSENTTEFSAGQSVVKTF
ncbi:lytic transglycosylase domain-containing protein [Burkholderia metallica]|uniref:lytic transglycosylase domain-containing protein n=1 Tax=Burkholderia metallica TaxID=488729 RepID=UPI00157AE87B|nr:lytic transglycosylase domain-containing protein [Burkholderia metallica]NTZ88890.1 lytic transglycosylase domain-containing protein [Burkholderia metallica]